MLFVFIVFYFSEVALIVLLCLDLVNDFIRCFLSSWSPKGATSFPDQGSYAYDQIRVSFCLLCLLHKTHAVHLMSLWSNHHHYSKVICLGVLSFIELCIFLSFAFVSMLAIWLTGKTYSYVEGFPLQRPDWRVIYCNDLFVCIPNT